ncbi:MAG: amino acid adenylation domain-containing protein, partial [bacterium]|nr:amino acid adenylation domain-containing protein [bacterium]
MKKDNVESVYELSPVQQGMLFHSLYAPGSGVYVVQLSVELRGNPDVPLFARAWQHVVDRHPALRTSFHWKKLKKPVQVVHRRLEVKLDHASWRGLSRDQQRQRLRDYLRVDGERGFALSTAPLMRLALFELDDETVQFIWSLHHLYLDGWSNSLILGEVLSCYEALSQRRPVELAPARPYRHYISWLRQRDLGEAKSFWQKLLAGFTAATPLAPWQDPSPPELGDYREREFVLSAASSAALHALARRHRLTLNTLVQGAWGLLLARYTGEQDVVFGNTTSGRPADLPGVESMVGLFINTVPVRLAASPGQPPLPWLERLQVLLAELRHYEYAPLEMVRDWSEIPAGTPLFDNLLVFENYPVDLRRDQGSQALELGNVHGAERTNYPMTVAVGPGPPPAVTFLYDRRTFDDAAVVRMRRHYENLLHGLAAEPSPRRLEEVSMLAAAERWQLVAEWNDTARAYPRNATLHELFEAQVERTPEAVAVVFDRHLSYRELNRRANRLAHHLRALGLGPEELTAIYLERSLATVVAILAVLKAGGAYLPLDLSYPPERLAFMLEDAGVPVLVTCEEPAATLPAELAERGVQLVRLDRDAPAIARRSDRNSAPAAGARHLAYVIYTSGSTGRPKGSGVSHRAVARLVVNTDYVAFGPDDRVAQASTTSFDAATFELWGALLHGTRLVGITKEVAIEPPAFAAALRAEGITVLFMTPALFNQMAKEDPAAFRDVRNLLVGGDVADPGWMREVLAGAGRGFAGRLLNAYGPTENTTFTTWQRVRAVPAGARTVPIGSPIANTEVYVLDRSLEPVPVGVAGELYAGGDGLARGYAGRAQLSAEKFVPHPFAARPGERLYRTGDLVRYLPEGAIEFLGRIDHQVKLRGFRVELGEIEAVLNGHGNVRESVVLVRDEIAAGDGRRSPARLVAYVVAGGEPLPAVRELREFLSQALPDYMVPAVVVFLDALPLTPNGKVDRRALPAPAASEILPEGELAAPGNPTEELLAGIWGEVLGVGGVGVHDDFFELGGHSLMATQLASRVRETFAVELPLRKIFEAPTVAELAAIIEAAQLEQRGLRIPPMVPVARDQELALSFAQQRLWFLYQLEPETPAYNVSAAVRLSGAVDAGIIERIFNEVVRRHEALRTTFTTAAGRPIQVIAERLRLPLPVADLDRLPEPRREAEARRLAGEEAQRPFDLAVGPLVRLTLLRLAEQDHVLAMTMHHIVSDGWSMGIFIRELSVLLEAFSQGNPSPLAELPLQYADFAHWQGQWLAGKVLEAEMAYWRVELAGAPRYLDLPTDRPRPAVVGYRGRIRELALSAELSGALATLSRGRDVTLYMTLLAAFAALLGRWCGQQDIVVGSPIAGRNRREIEGLIGFFVNTLVLRTDLTGDPSFEQLSARVRRVALNAYAHQNLPFEQLVEELQPRRDASLHPLFQVMFALQNAPQPTVESSGLALTPLAIERVTAAFDLTLSLQETEAGVRGTLEYRTDLFDEVTILRLAAHFTTLLAGVVRDPGARLSDLPLLSPAENHQLTLEWNDTRSDYPQGRTIHELFELWAERTPDAPAVVFEDRYLSYRELNRRANQLAPHLRALGVGGPASRSGSPGGGQMGDSLIGIAVERSAEMVVDLLAILKAGGAYLPLDPAYPTERLAFMLEDARSPVVLVRQQARERLDGIARRLATGSSPAFQRVCPDGDRETISRQSPENPRCCVRPDGLAYVLYTSGSTGRPKGVGVAHRSVVRLVRETDYAELSSREVFLQFAPVSFDASTLEIWGPLANGGRLVIFPEARTSLEELANAIARHRVSTLWLTAGLFHQMADRHPRGLRPLRQLLAGGDVLSAPQVRKVLEEVAGLTLINGYGPTENTTFTCCQSFRAPAEVPAPVAIGRPIANTRVWLLDRRLRPVPVGVVGELTTAGDGLARCYLHRPQQTAEAFIPHPLSERGGERLYRTGDLARYLADGRIDFLGRIDHQVKLRGFRIELGEIEAVLSRHPGVRETAVMLREDVPGDPRLVAYVVADREPVPEVERFPRRGTNGGLRELMKTTLPEFMVPSAFVFPEALPLTPQGKVDRRALPAPEGPPEAPEDDLVAPADPTEELLAGIWAEVLHREKVGAGDNFFELGGHSLLATQVVSRVRETFGVEIPLRQLFEASTLAELAGMVHSARQQARGVAAPPLLPVARDQELPLSFAQQRLWFLDQFEPASAAYNMANALRLSGAVNAARLEWIFNALVRRHEILRTTFPAVAGRPRQVIAPRLELPLPLADLQNLTAERREAEVRRLAAEEALRPFDLQAGPLIRLALLRLADQDHVLLVTMHHIVADGWSMGIFSRELQALYAAALYAVSAGGESAPPPELPELPIQYVDFAHWQRQWLTGEVLETEMAYWRKQLAGAPPHLDLPIDRPRPAVPSFRGRTREIAFPEELSRALAARSRDRDVTLFMTLLAAFKTLLSRYSGQDDVVVGSPIAGRNRREIEGLIGFFVNTLVLRTDLAGGTADRNPDFARLLAGVRQMALDAYAHQDVPFEQLVDELQPQRDPSLHPLFQVMFVLQNTPQGAPESSGESSGLTVTPLETERVKAAFDLTLSLQESAAGLVGSIEYSTDLFDEVTIERLTGHLRTLLAGIVVRPDERLSDYPLLNAAEKHQLRSEWNDTRDWFPRRGTNGRGPRRGTNGRGPRRGTNGRGPRRGTYGRFPES